MRQRISVADSTTRWLAARDRTTGALLALGLTLPTALALVTVTEYLPGTSPAPETAILAVTLFALAASAACRLHERHLSRRLPPVPPVPAPILGPASRTALRLKTSAKGLAAAGVVLALVALAVHLVSWASGRRADEGDLLHHVALVGVALGVSLIPVTRAICRAEIDRRRTARLNGDSTDQPA